MHFHTSSTTLAFAGMIVPESIHSTVQKIQFRKVVRNDQKKKSVSHGDYLDSYPDPSAARFLLKTRFGA